MARVLRGQKGQHSHSASRVLKRVAKTATGSHFALPVPVGSVPGYLEAVEKPMDISTVVSNIQAGLYSTTGSVVTC